MMGAWRMGVRALVIGAFSALVIAGTAAAQTISVGAAANGELAASDTRVSGGQYQDVFTLRGRAGQNLRINLDSEVMDTLVRVSGPGNFSAEDDDSGDGLNAQLDITLPANGEYRIVATTFGADRTGAYTLRVTEVPAAASIRVGQSLNGALAASDGRAGGGQFEDVYVITGRAGQVLRVNLDSSGFDPLVRMTGPEGFSAQDDDSGEGLNAQLDVTLAASGQYRIVATSYSAEQTGAYTLRVSERDPRTVAATAAPTGAIRLGQTVNGALSANDPTRSSGQYADAYTFEGQQGQTVEVRLSSSAYDPFLAISGPGAFQAENDDDMESSEPLRNSRLVVTLPQTGTYRIQATSFATGSTGDYRLSVSQGAATSAAQAVSGQVLAFGQAAQGRLQQGDGQLRSGEFTDAFRFLGQAGQRVAIELTSTEFDTYIILRKPDGTQQDNDDDERGNNGTNSRIELTLEETGEYHVHATSFQPGESGSYRIIVTDLSTQRETAPPPSTASAGAVGNNQTTNGSLSGSDPTMTDGQHYDLYTFNGRRGQNVTLEVTSNNFDTYMMLVFPSGEGVEDDDGVAGTTNSRISGGLPEDGEYTVVVSSYSAGATGNYALRMNLGAASASAPAVSTPTASAGSGRVFLLSVGISDYGGFASNLSYTADDARNLYAALQQSGSLAQGSAVLVDAQATVANVRSAFQRIASQVGPDDLFFFFYSGHGSQDNATGGGELDGRDEFLVMVDGLISDDEMARMFAGLRARLSVIALDACFSGGFARDVIQNPRIMGLFSSDEDLTSAVAGKFQAGGYLSHFLRTGFQGEADENRNGQITAGELHSYLWRRFASEQNIGAQSMDGERNYQRLVVDRGGVKIDDVVISLGR